MQPAEAVRYTGVSQQQFDRFKNVAKAKGVNISGNKDQVTMDLIPLDVENDPTAKVLVFHAQEPFWVTPGAVTGALHAMVAQIMAPPEEVPAAAAKAPEGNRLAEKP